MAHSKQRRVRARPLDAALQPEAERDPAALGTERLDEELSGECVSETVTGILPETRRPRYYRSLSDVADIHICIAAIAQIGLSAPLSGTSARWRHKPSRRTEEKLRRASPA